VKTTFKALCRAANRERLVLLAKHFKRFDKWSLSREKIAKGSERDRVLLLRQPGGVFREFSCKGYPVRQGGIVHYDRQSVKKHCSVTMRLDGLFYDS
jgi:hypothetical protein